MIVKSWNRCRNRNWGNRNGLRDRWSGSNDINVGYWLIGNGPRFGGGQFALEFFNPLGIFVWDVIVQAVRRSGQPLHQLRFLIPHVIAVQPVEQNMGILIIQNKPLPRRDIGVLDHQDARPPPREVRPGQHRSFMALRVDLQEVNRAIADVPFADLA